MLVGELHHRRVTPFPARTTTPFADPHNPRRWFTRSTLILRSQIPGQNEPRNAKSANSGDALAAKQSSGGPAPPPARPTILSRPIKSQRMRLDWIQTESGSSDPKPTAQIRRYPFGLDFF